MVDVRWANNGDYPYDWTADKVDDDGSNRAENWSKQMEPLFVQKDSEF